MLPSAVSLWMHSRASMWSPWLSRYCRRCCAMFVLSGKPVQLRLRTILNREKPNSTSTTTDNESSSYASQNWPIRRPHCVYLRNEIIYHNR
ncbi:hypothetical protein EI94DRAFT_1753571 [Lactarius quietus]|nr:hypothetical protein EI94DRAFT_1147462 [Lactarius quietus]KAF8258773.1 hypothetical protein EI94DRAFT_1753571 [Lactarius quietus]